jgi:hypothetical protein
LIRFSKIDAERGHRSNFDQVGCATPGEFVISGWLSV